MSNALRKKVSTYVCTVGKKKCGCMYKNAKTNYGIVSARALLQYLCKYMSLKPVLVVMFVSLYHDVRQYSICRDGTGGKWLPHVRCYVVGKMSKDIGMAIRKSIAGYFLPCLFALLGFHPYIFFRFFKNVAYYYRT